MAPDTRHLVAAAGKGDPTAATALIELSYTRVFALLRRLTDHEADAADLTQQTFSRAWKSLPSFAGRSSFNTWVHGIAYHVYLDWRKAPRRAEPRSIEWWLCIGATAPQPDEAAARSDSAARLYAEVDQLEADLRDTIHLRYYQDLSIEETAEAMGVAGSTVQYRIRQALDVLHKRLAQEKPVAIGR
jgi:RNA polymerase sigma-70 factor (ECF subfamily)